MLMTRWKHPFLLSLERFLWGVFVVLIITGGVWYKSEYPDLHLENMLVWVFIALGGFILSLFTPLWVINPATKTLSCKRLPRSQSWDLSTTKLLFAEETSRNWRYESVSSYTVFMRENQQTIPIASLSPSEHQKLLAFCQRFAIPYEEDRHA
jgi:hypothetical protein